MEIWKFAKDEAFVLVSKDEDFFHFSVMETGAQFVWIRVGNCRNSVLYSILDKVLPSLVESLDEGAKVVEIR